MKRCDVIKDWIYCESMPLGIFDKKTVTFRVSLTVDEKGRVCHRPFWRTLYENDGNWECSVRCSINLVGLHENSEEVPAEELEIRYDCLRELYSDTLFTRIDEDGDRVKDYAAWAVSGLSDEQIDSVCQTAEVDIRDNEELERVSRNFLTFSTIYYQVLQARLCNAGLR